MSDNRQNGVRDAIAYLDGFYRDLSLLLDSLISVMEEMGFVLHPLQGNKIA